MPVMGSLGIYPPTARTTVCFTKFASTKTSSINLAGYAGIHCHRLIHSKTHHLPAIASKSQAVSRISPSQMEMLNPASS